MTHSKELHRGSNGRPAVLTRCFLAGAAATHQKAHSRLNVQWISNQSSKVIQQEEMAFSKIVLEQIDKQMQREERNSNPYPTPHMKVNPK